jgi:hypothetical protein
VFIAPFRGKNPFRTRVDMSPTETHTQLAPRERDASLTAMEYWTRGKLSLGILFLSVVITALHAKFTADK